MRDAHTIWKELAGWAERWELPVPRLSATWIDLPDTYRAQALDGWIERRPFEPPASSADEAGLVTATGLVIPRDLRELHAVHDGSFAPLLPLGMSLLPYAAMETTWRSLVELAADAEDDTPVNVAAGTHLEVAFHRRWLPIASGDDTVMVLDFAPGPAGADGQVLLRINECDYVPVAASTAALLDRWLDLLVAGAVAFDAAVGEVVAAGDDAIEDLLRS